jgi:hypothetical protein
MSDLIERLRRRAPLPGTPAWGGAVVDPLYAEAAAELARLTAENGALRAERDAARELHRGWVEGPDGLKWYIAQLQATTVERDALRAVVAEAREAAARLVEDAPDHGISKQSLWRLAAAIRALPAGSKGRASDG